MNISSRPNSWVFHDVSLTTQLTYALQLDPAPLTVSISGHDPILASLQFVLTNPTSSPIAVNSVGFTIQVGTNSSDLTPSTATIGTSVSDITDWQVQSPGSTTSGPATYTLLPQTGSSVSIAAGASVIVEIFNFPTVQNPGNSTINIKETVSSTNSFTSFEVTTFPTGFYFNSLLATVESGSQLAPIAQIATGSSITLLWNSSVVDLGSFAIYYSNASQGQQKATPTDTGAWASPALSSDTVFTVVITVSVSGGSPLTAALTTSVSVQNPTLIAASITTGQATITGSASVSGALSANAVTATGLTVNGPATVGGNSVLNNATVNGTLNVAGSSTVAALTVNSSLTAMGFVSLNAGLQANGGPAALMQGAVLINPGTYGAVPTDGFVLGFASATGAPDSICVAFISGSSGAISLQALGANTVNYIGSGGSKATSSGKGNFLLPVLKGNGFSISVFTPPFNASAPITSFWWVPFGSAATPGSMESLRIGDAAPPDHFHVAVAHSHGRAEE